MTNDLAGFLLQRVAEDEVRARAAIDDDCGSDEGFSGQLAALSVAPSGIGPARGGFGKAAAMMIATYAVPRRILAECGAKRRIIELHHRVEGVSGNLDDPDEFCSECEVNDSINQWPCRTLRLLALPYADHPDYREEWRP